MTFYSAHLKPDAEPVLVPEGFSIAALLFGPLWLAAHRAWIPAALSLAAYALIAALAHDPARIILTAGLSVLLGLSAQDLRRWTLEQKGYLLTNVFAVRDAEEALQRLMTIRPDVANRYRPDPA